MRAAEPARPTGPGCGLLTFLSLSERDPEVRR